MSRLIDADALIEDIREHSASYFADDFAHEWVDQQPTIEPEPKWIPVSKKAHPAKEGKYLVTDDAGGMATVEVDDYIYCDDGSGMWLCSQNVTAWMSLPESYRGDEDGQ